MDTAKLTQMSRQAVTDAQNVARRLNHNEVDTWHLLSALLTQENGLVSGIVDKLGLTAAALALALSDAPLLRLAWNRLDNFYIAAVSGGSFRTAIIDVRMPSVPVAELPGAAAGHTAAVGAVAWAPHSACHVVTGADDCQALIWDLSTLPKAVEDPILAYT
jgi:WD40 repeat protein